MLSGPTIWENDHDFFYPNHFCMYFVLADTEKLQVKTDASLEITQNKKPPTAIIASQVVVRTNYAVWIKVNGVKYVSI